MAWSVLGDGERPEVFFIAIERGSLAVTVHKVSEDLLRIGEDAALAALERWKACNMSGVWPGYGDDVFVVDPPAWLRGAVVSE